MGVAASFDSRLSTTSIDRYYCHSCCRVFRLDPSENLPNLLCPHCRSSFLEEMGSASNQVSNRHGNLTFDQARRISNAAAMLRLLEFQLREELSFLRLAFSHANQRIHQDQAHISHFSKIMKGKLRKIVLDLDTICNQPSCPICSEDFLLHGEAHRLPCSHIFHHECVISWLRIKQNCPICRCEVTNTIPTIDELQRLSVEELDERLRDADVNVENVSDKGRDELAELLLKTWEQYQKSSENSPVDHNSQIASSSTNNSNSIQYVSRNRSSDFPLLAFSLRTLSPSHDSPTGDEDSEEQRDGSEGENDFGDSSSSRFQIINTHRSPLLRHTELMSGSDVFPLAVNNSTEPVSSFFPASSSLLLNLNRLDINEDHVSNIANPDSNRSNS